MVVLRFRRGDPHPAGPGPGGSTGASCYRAPIASACPTHGNRRLPLTFALALAVLAALGWSGTAAGAPGATRFVSTTGSDSNPCTASRPCRSLDRAYTVSRPGTVVSVAAGSYPGQRIDATPKKKGPRILFRPANGAKVTFSSIRVVRGSYIEFRGFRVSNDTYNEAGAKWISYRYMSMRQFFVRSADHILYEASNIGPNDSNDGMNWISAQYQKNDPATYIRLNRVRIHDFTKHNSGAHIDCVAIDDANHVSITNSRFWNCEHFAILFGLDSTTNRGARNVLIQNNFLDCCISGYYSIGLGDVGGPMKIRFNSLTLGLGWLGGTVRNVTVDSNVIANNNAANCNDATWRYNVVARGSACGGRRAATAFTDPPQNLHLSRRSAAAVAYGNPKSFPRTDIDGQKRKKGRRPDAGADELN